MHPALPLYCGAGVSSYCAKSWVRNVAERLAAVVAEARVSLTSQRHQHLGFKSKLTLGEHGASIEAASAAATTTHSASLSNSSDDGSTARPCVARCDSESDSEPLTILDFGCGPGEGTAALLKTLGRLGPAARVLLCDATADMLHRAAAAVAPFLRVSHGGLGSDSLTCPPPATFHGTAFTLTGSHGAAAGAGAACSPRGCRSPVRAVSPFPEKEHIGPGSQPERQQRLDPSFLRWLDAAAPQGIDVFLCSLVAEYLTEEQTAALAAAVTTRLRPGGVAVFADWGPHPPYATPDDAGVMRPCGISTAEWHSLAGNVVAATTDRGSGCRLPVGVSGTVADSELPPATADLLTDSRRGSLSAASRTVSDASTITLSLTDADSLTVVTDTLSTADSEVSASASAARRLSVSDCLESTLTHTLAASGGSGGSGSALDHGLDDAEAAADAPSHCVGTIELDARAAAETGGGGTTIHYLLLAKPLSLRLLRADSDSGISNESNESNGSETFRGLGAPLRC